MELDIVVIFQKDQLKSSSSYNMHPAALSKHQDTVGVSYSEISDHKILKGHCHSVFYVLS